MTATCNSNGTWVWSYLSFHCQHRNTVVFNFILSICVINSPIMVINIMQSRLSFWGLKCKKKNVMNVLNHKKLLQIVQEIVTVYRDVLFPIHGIIKIEVNKKQNKSWWTSALIFYDNYNKRLSSFFSSHWHTEHVTFVIIETKKLCEMQELVFTMQPSQPFSLKQIQSYYVQP